MTNTAPLWQGVIQIIQKRNKNDNSKPPNSSVSESENKVQSSKITILHRQHVPGIYCSTTMPFCRSRARRRRIPRRTQLATSRSMTGYRSSSLSKTASAAAVNSGDSCVTGFDAGTALDRTCSFAAVIMAAVAARSARCEGSASGSNVAVGPMANSAACNHGWSIRTSYEGLSNGFFSRHADVKS